MIKGKWETNKEHDDKISIFWCFYYSLFPNKLFFKKCPSEIGQDGRIRECGAHLSPWMYKKYIYM